MVYALQLSEVGLPWQEFRALSTQCDTQFSHCCEGSNQQPSGVQRWLSTGQDKEEELSLLL